MSAKKKNKPRHLGRGLQSLLGPITETTEMDIIETHSNLGSANFPPDKELDDSLLRLSVNDILPNPYQPRTEWNQEELADLAESIKTNGLLQPIVVRRVKHGDQGHYEIIAGERRFRAAKMVGLETIPAMVRDADDAQLLELALIENIHRTNLNPIERAKAYQNYIETFSISQTEAAQRLGEDRSVIANFIRLLDLPEQVKEMLMDGSLSPGHARAILSLPTDKLRTRLANRALAGQLSVREVERLVKLQLAEPKEGQMKTEFVKPPHIKDLEDKMRSQLGTKVIIQARKNGQRGKIVIEFYSLDEFDRITEKIGIARPEV
jgi:ParB family transcriptional regulator, chromosome partitioning protein